MLLNRDFNSVSFPYAAPLRKPSQIDTVPHEYRKLLLDAWNIGENKEALNLDTVKWALTHTNVTSLSNSHDENEGWMRMVVSTTMNAEVKGKHPYHVSSVTIWGTEKKDGDNFKDLIERFDALDVKELPTLAAAVNYPYGDMPVENAVKSIERAASWLKDYKGNKVITSVLDYQAWIEGAEVKATESLRAQAEVAHKAGFKFKAAMVASAHVLNKNNNFYSSLYQATTCALEAGVDIIQTSTDKALKEPYSSSVAQDITTPEAMLPVLAAVRDFNRLHKTNRGVEIAGGQISPLDAVRARFMVEKVAGAKLLANTTIGGSYMFARNLMKYIADNQSNSSLAREHFGPQGRKMELPKALRGI